MENLVRLLPETGYLLAAIFWGSVVVYVVMQCYMLFRDCFCLARILAVLPFLVAFPYLLLTIGSGGPAGPYFYGPTIVLSTAAALYLFAIWGVPRVIEWCVNRFN
jgi:hypothetical protein